jgi:Flp pilus assembly protein TadG
VKRTSFLPAVFGFLTDISGNFAITFAICAIPVMLAAGMALDYTQVINYKSRLQAAVDAAALAVAQDMTSLDDTGLNRMADDYLRANLTADDYAQVSAVQVQVDRVNKALTIVADGNMPTSFTRLAGYETLDYGVKASIHAAYGGLEALLVLDNTGSMARNNKIGDLKKAAKQFVSEMLARNGVEQVVKIGLVPFSNYVNVGMSNRNAAWITVPPDQAFPQSRWYGCVGSREYPLNLKDSDYATRVPGVMNVECAAEVLPLTADEAALNNAINRMQPNGLTYIPAGVSWGIRTLSAVAPFTGGATEQEARDKSITKAIVLMTDGENTISKDLNLPTHNSRDLAETNRWTLESCTIAKAQGIKVYTMVFGDEVPPAAAQLIKSCASSPEYYFDASNGAQLEQAFGDIAVSLSKLYLSQ